MMIRLILILLLSLTILPAYPEDHTIKAEIENMPSEPVFLALVRGEEIILKDSTLPASGKFTFVLPENAEKGIYRISFGRHITDNHQTSSFDLICNNENVVLETDFADPLMQMKILQSKENKLYYRFIKLRMAYRYKFLNLKDLVDIYEPSDDFYPALRGEILQVQKNLTDSILLITSEDPSLMASSLVSMYREPVWDPFTDMPYVEFMQAHFLDPVVFDDPALINSPVYNRKILSYLSFYRDPSKNPHELEKGFIRAVDVIMEKSSYNQQVYEFVMNYLIDGFEQFQMEEVLVHIADNYLEGECETDSKRIMEERLKAYQRMAPGKIVDDIVLLDIFDVPQRMSELDSEYTLLLFWASWCPHCQNLLPRLKKWFADQDPGTPDISLYAVSIDTSRIEWEEFVLSNDLPGTHVLEQGGWEGTYSREFNIYATPMMFILDKKRKIIGKPVTYRDFKKVMGGLE